jgi:serine/threonine-protein kinase
VEAGLVSTTNPAIGVSVSKGSTVTVYTSNGLATEIADVTGKPSGSSKQELEAQGFTVTVAEEATTDPAQAGKTLRTDPVAGTPKNPASGPVTMYVGATQ